MRHLNCTYQEFLETPQTVLDDLNILLAAEGRLEDDRRRRERSRAR
jgi:hypothetical protein